MQLETVNLHNGVKVWVWPSAEC